MIEQRRNVTRHMGGHPGSRRRAQKTERSAPQTILARLDAIATRALTRFSVSFLRVSLGLVFLGFGILKFFPDVSPAQGIAEQTTDALTLGVVSGTAAVVFVAALETAIGLSLITGRYLRFGLALLGVAMVGILSPLVLFPDDLFAGRYNAPTLAGQYVMKDVVLFASGLVVAAGERGGRMVTRRDMSRLSDIEEDTVADKPEGK